MAAVKVELGALESERAIISQKLATLQQEVVGYEAILQRLRREKEEPNGQDL